MSRQRGKGCIMALISNKRGGAADGRTEFRFNDDLKRFYGYIDTVLSNDDFRHAVAMLNRAYRLGEEAGSDAKAQEIRIALNIDNG